VLGDVERDRAGLDVGCLHALAALERGLVEGERLDHERAGRLRPRCHVREAPRPFVLLGIA
jgi:hypothetical protein